MQSSSLIFRRLASTMGSLGAREFPMNFSHYQILDIPHSADSSAIKKAFRALSKKYHPDMHGSSPNKQVVKSNYLRIITAYKTLSNTAARKKYDQQVNARTVSKRPHFHTAASTGGTHFSRTRAHYRPMSQSTYAGTGDNHDVPHFDFNEHLRGNLWFERRMINKRLNNQQSGADEPFQRTNTHDEQKFRERIEDEIDYTMNLHRFGSQRTEKQHQHHQHDHTHQYQPPKQRRPTQYAYGGGFSIHSGGTTTAVLLLSVGLLAASSMFMN